MTSRQRGAFWDDLARDLQDTAFARQYVIESARIATIDGVVNSLDEAREAEGLSKADVARAVGSDPAVIRRLFGSGRVNPTLGTLAEVAAALGLRITVEKIPGGSRDTVSTPALGQRAVARPAKFVRTAPSRRSASTGKTADSVPPKAVSKSRTKGKPTLVTR